jgi:hypothetical protein
MMWLLPKYSILAQCCNKGRHIIRFDHFKSVFSFSKLTERQKWKSAKVRLDFARHWEQIQQPRQGAHRHKPFSAQ